MTFKNIHVCNISTNSITIRTSVQEFLRNIEIVPLLASQHTYVTLFFEEFPDHTHIYTFHNEYHVNARDILNRHDCLKPRLLNRNWLNAPWIKQFHEVVKALESSTLQPARYVSSTTILSENIYADYEYTHDPLRPDPSTIQFDDVQALYWCEQFDKRYLKDTHFNKLPEHLREYIYSYICSYSKKMSGHVHDM